MANHLRARPRMLIAAVLGCASAWAMPASSIVTRSLVGWNVGVWLYLLLIAVTMFRADHGKLRKAALAHSDGAFAISVLLVSAMLASFAAIVVELASAKAAGTPHAFPQMALTLSTVAASWLLLPTIFTLNYASLYYTNDSCTGLRFPDAGDDFKPHYFDFLYFSFTIAVALQTADIALTTPAMRLLVLAQSLLSFAFNTTVLALLINIAASLF